MTKLTKKECIWGVGYAIVEFLVLPTVITAAGQLLDMESWLQNCLLYLISAVALGMILRHFLAENWKMTFHTPWKTLRWAGVCLMAYYGANFLISVLTVSCFPDFGNLNDETVGEFVRQGGATMTFATVVLAPFGEELIFRGLLFRGLYDRSRTAAWLVSVGCFAAVHVIGYIGLYQPAMLLIAFVQYLPAGLCLCWAYRASGSIFAPLIMHIAVNQVALGLMS